MSEESKFKIEKPPICYKEREKWYDENNYKFWLFPVIRFLLIYSFILFLLPHVIPQSKAEWVQNVYEYYWITIVIDLCHSYFMCDFKKSFAIGHLIIKCEMFEDTIRLTYLNKEDNVCEATLPLNEYRIIIESYQSQSKCLNIKTKNPDDLCVINIMKKNKKKEEYKIFEDFFYQYNLFGWSKSDFREIRKFPKNNNPHFYIEKKYNNPPF